MFNLSNYTQLQQQLHPYEASLVAVTKNQPIAALQQLYDAGQRIFAENRVQDLAVKHPQLPPDVAWHLIGHLQRNKVRQVVPLVSCIQSVDSPQLLYDINRHAAQIDRPIDVLLQVHIAAEATKFGFTPNELCAFLAQQAPHSLSHARITGLMGMATFTDNQAQISVEMQQLKALFDSCQRQFFATSAHFFQLSMGMSGDYPIALSAGSNMVRVGSLLFE